MPRRFRSSVFPGIWRQETGSSPTSIFRKPERKTRTAPRNTTNRPEGLYDEGFFDVPGIAAHCVFLSDEDRAILREKNITAVHNP
jgi:cytosine/adenosine deaminase-related metal-dependent hydrolase